MLRTGPGIFSGIQGPATGNARRSAYETPVSSAASVIACASVGLAAHLRLGRTRPYGVSDPPSNAPTDNAGDRSALAVEALLSPDLTRSNSKVMLGKPLSPGGFTSSAATSKAPLTRRCLPRG